MVETIEAKQTPPTLKGAVMRDRILAAAAQVFAKKGYELTRVADITKATKTSHGNFYRHFNNKDEVLIAVLRPLLEDVYKSVRRRPGSPLLLSEREFIQGSIDYLKAYARHRKLLRVMREAAARGEQASFFSLWIGERSRFTKRNAAWLARLKQAGRLPPEFDPELTAETLGALTEQIAYVKIGLAAKPPSEKEIERIGLHCAMIWYRGVFGRSDASVEIEPEIELLRARE